MREVWKYQLGQSDCTIPMPAGAKILTVHAQTIAGQYSSAACAVPMLWALVDPEAPRQPRRFRVVATGQPLTFETDRYIGTFQFEDLGLVFHVFEIEP